MGPKESSLRRVSDSERLNPDSTWLAPLVLDSPSISAFLHPTRNSRAVRGFYRNRVDEEKIHAERYARSIGLAYERERGLVFGKDRFLLESDTRELQFRDAIRAFLNARGVGRDADSDTDDASMRVLVVGTAVHDRTIPYEIGDFAKEVTFVGPLYDETTRKVCTNAYAGSSNCQYTALSDEQMGLGVLLDRTTEYDLILLYSNYTNPEFSSGQFAEHLFRSLKPDGRIIASSHASLDPMRDAILGIVDEAGVFDIQTYPETVYVVPDAGSVYVPKSRLDPEIVIKRVVHSIGLEEIDPEYNVFEPVPKRPLSTVISEHKPTGKQLLISSVVAGALGIIPGDMLHTLPYACPPGETTIYPQDTTAIDSYFPLPDGKQVIIFTGGGRGAISLYPSTVFSTPASVPFTSEGRKYQAIVSPQETVVCAAK